MGKEVKEQYRHVVGQKLSLIHISGQEHNKPVKPISESCMGRYTVFESIQKESEAFI